MSTQIFHFSNTGISSGQRFYLKDEVPGLYLRNINIDSNSSIVGNNLVYNTGNQTISGAKTFVAGISAPNLIYNTGNQNISGQKRFVDQDVIQTFPISPFGTKLQPSIFSAGHPGPGNYFFVPRSEYRPVVFPNPSYYYSGVNTTGAEIYFNTGTSRWWFTYNGILQDASPIVTAGQPFSFVAPLPLNNWSGGNMQFAPVYSHNISHYSDGADPINPILINAVAITGGNQTISGTKTFVNNQTFSGNINVSGTGIFNAIDLNNIDNLSLSGVDITITSGVVNLTNRPLVNGTGVLLSGEAVASNGTINSIIRLTQASYNALSPKNPNTFYVIVG